MSIFKDFVGINICIYDPILTDTGAIGGNTFGYGGTVTFPYNYDTPSGMGMGIARYTDSAGQNNVSPLTQTSIDTTLVLLNLHRNGPYGYPMWKQMRTSQNPLSRAHKLTNTFTYVQEPGAVIGDKQAKYGDIVSLTEPSVGQNLPISLIGEVAVYNDELGIFENKPVELKTSFNNETMFFANDKANNYFNTILETDENYESLKSMYLDGGLDDDGSLLDAFALFTYRQTVWPKQQHAFLDNTRSRNFYVNTFWRDNRSDRTQTDVDTGHGATVPSQSMWPLDVAADWETRGIPSASSPAGRNSNVFGYYIGGAKGGRLHLGTLSDLYGFNTGEDKGNTDYAAPFSSASLGGSGILMNSYSRFTRGSYIANLTDTPNLNLAGTISALQDTLSSSCHYTRRHSMYSIQSVVSPSGMEIQETGSQTFIATGSVFEGMAAWDAWKEKGNKPFYDSYADFAQELRPKGKGYSTVPEFRISSHVETYETKGVTEELQEIFELSGALSQNTTTENESSFYKILSNSDFLKHFDLIKKDHKGFADEKILTLKCKALKKFLPYEGFYPAQRCVDLSKRFVDSYGSNFSMIVDDISSGSVETSLKNIPVIEPLFSPGILFNTVKSGVAVDYPIIINDHAMEINRANNNGSEGHSGPRNNYYIYASTEVSQAGSSPSGYTLRSIFSERIPFEALIEPEKYLSDIGLRPMEPHPFGLSDVGFYTSWDGQGDTLFKKMSNNMLAEITDFFMKDSQLTTLSSLEEQNPEFGNAESGSFYAMRVKMKRSRNMANDFLGGYGGTKVVPPQDQYSRLGVRENFTMYSRPSSFGPAVYGGSQSGSMWGIANKTNPMGDQHGNNYCYTPPYYYGEAWCDLIFECTESKKYTLDEILPEVREYPYFTRYFWPGVNDTLRDLTGYSSSFASNIATPNSKYFDYGNSPWATLFQQTGLQISGNVIKSDQKLNWLDNTVTEINEYPICVGWANPYVPDFSSSLGTNAVFSTSPNARYIPQHPANVNYNAMQIDSSVNIFGKGTVREIFDKDTGEKSEVASGDTVRGKTRWIIQTKFETPILNFNKYTNLTDNNLTMPSFASESVPRGMWHQYGETPTDPSIGVFLQVDDIPLNWMKGTLGIGKGLYQKKVKSLADLCGFSKEAVKLGQPAQARQISECVVAVPFIEQGATRKFFSIPRADIDSCIDAARREIAGQFPAGGPPKAGDTVYEMVKKMQKYVFPPSMDFVRYEEIDPFAMYVFEFKHDLSKEDITDLWQNLPPEIGTSIDEAEASISHELLSAELLGQGAVVKNGELDENAEGKGMPSNIQWMVFKVKKRAKTNYFDKVVAKTGLTKETSDVKLEGVSVSPSGKIDKDITYNWPYDFFSLVELVKIDAEISFANTENDDKGQKSIKKVESTRTRDPSMISKARGKGKIE
jgi:hypothetical protein